MGQIIGSAAKLDACNIRSLSSFGIPDVGEIYHNDDSDCYVNIFGYNGVVNLK